MLGAVFALSSVLIPFFFGAAIGGIASGRVPVGNAAGDLIDSLAEPDLGRDRRRRHPHRRAPRRRLPRRATRCAPSCPTWSRAFRARALGSGIVAGRRRARRPAVVAARRARRSTTGSPPATGCSRCSSPARPGSPRSPSSPPAASAPRAFTAALAVGGDDGRLGARPGPVPAARRAHARGGRRERRDADRLVVSVGLGMLVLVPSLWWLYRLVLRGTLDQEYEPLDQRFQPVAREPVDEAHVRAASIARALAARCCSSSTRSRRDRRVVLLVPRLHRHRGVSHRQPVDGLWVGTRSERPPQAASSACASCPSSAARPTGGSARSRSRENTPRPARGSPA